MKKRNIISLLIPTILLESCSLFYSIHIDKDDFHYAAGGLRDDAYLYQIDYTGKTNNFTVPDYVDEYPVTKLGGYYGRGYPMPFSVSFFDYEISSRDLQPGDYEIKCYGGDVDDLGNKENIVYKDFYINLGDKIKEIYSRFNYLELKIMDIEYCFVTRFHFNVSANNKKFYSVDGKLYSKDNELIDDFLYF